MDARTEEEVPEKCLSSLQAKELMDICECVSTFAFFADLGCPCCYNSLHGL
jgi:hypothetical protein